MKLKMHSLLKHTKPAMLAPQNYLLYEQVFDIIVWRKLVFSFLFFMLCSLLIYIHRLQLLKSSPLRHYFKLSVVNFVFLFGTRQTKQHCVFLQQFIVSFSLAVLQAKLFLVVNEIECWGRMKGSISIGFPLNAKRFRF